MSHGETGIMDMGRGTAETGQGTAPPTADAPHAQDMGHGAHAHATAEADSACALDNKRSLTDDPSANESAQLLPHRETQPAPVGVPGPALPQPQTPPNGCVPAETPPPPLNGHPHNGSVSNGTTPICSPPPSRAPHPAQCNCHAHPGRRPRLSSAPSGKSQHSLKSTAAQIQQAAGDDLCASLLLACLWCRLADCIFLSAEGCGLCTSALCSSLCSSFSSLSPLCCCCSCTGGSPSLLEEGMLEVGQCCWGGGGCLDTHCCGGLHWDCSLWDACLQTTECLELGMEVSQLLFH